MKLTRAWFIFYGHMLHMDEQEIMSMRYGSMLDMISCFSIYRGAAKQKERKKKLTYDEIIRLK